MSATDKADAKTSQEISSSVSDLKSSVNLNATLQANAAQLFGSQAAAAAALYNQFNPIYTGLGSPFQQPMALFGGPGGGLAGGGGVFGTLPTFSTAGMFPGAMGASTPDYLLASAMMQQSLLNSAATAAAMQNTQTFADFLQKNLPVSNANSKDTLPKPDNIPTSRNSSAFKSCSIFPQTPIPPGPISTPEAKSGPAKTSNSAQGTTIKKPIPIKRPQTPAASPEVTPVPTSPPVVKKPRKSASATGDLPELDNMEKWALAALSNSFLKGVQQSLINQAMNAALTESSSTTGIGHSKSPGTPTASTLPRKTSNRGRPPTITSPDPLTASVENVIRNSCKKVASAKDTEDHLDSTIECVIKQQTRSDNPPRGSSKPPPASLSGGSGAGLLTVKEQLALKRNYPYQSQSTSGSGTPGVPTMETNVSSRQSRLFMNGTSGASRSEFMNGNCTTTTTATTGRNDSSGTTMKNGCNHKSEDDLVPLDLSKAAPKTVVHSENWTHTDLSGKTANYDETTERFGGPLRKGWRRETHIRSISGGIVKGEVVYYAPGGKKISNESELEQYLALHSFHGFSLIDFTFDENILLGEFVERPLAGKMDTLRLSPEEVKVRLALDSPSPSPVEHIANASQNQNVSLGGLSGVTDTNLKQERTSPTQNCVKESVAVKSSDFDDAKHAQLLYTEQLIRREEKMAAKYAQKLQLKQLRQPVEDMDLPDIKKLPEAACVSWQKISDSAFANCLMVLEFLHNFGEVLGIDPSDIPTMRLLHDGLLNGGSAKAENAVLNVAKILVTLVLEFPGLPSGSSKTLVGQPVKEIEVCQENMSELLRLFLMSRDAEGKNLGQSLYQSSFQSLCPEVKASLLAFMCNELVYCRNVVREIENSMDEVSKLKSQRWALGLRARQGDAEELVPPLSDASKAEKIENTVNRLISRDHSDSINCPAKGATCKSEKISNDLASIRKGIWKASSKIRVPAYGQDRYFRNIWALPREVPGLLVEPSYPLDQVPSWPPPPHQTEVHACLESLLDEVEMCASGAQGESCEVACSSNQSRNPIDLTITGILSGKILSSPESRLANIPQAKTSGWKSLTTFDQFLQLFRSLNTRGVRERILQRNFTKQEVLIKDLIFGYSAPDKPLSEVSESIEEPQECDKSEVVPLSEKQFENILSHRVLEAVQDLERKVFMSSVHVKHWKPQDDSDDEENSYLSDFDADTSSSLPRILSWNIKDSFQGAKDRLADLELNIDRRYLKPPFAEKPTIPDLAAGSDNTSDSNSKDSSSSISPELDLWRSGLKTANTPSQVYLCAAYLDSKIAWERSAMKAFCQICRGGENDSQLLLCDGCDRGYHTYCFRPQMLTIPEGNWYCPACITLATQAPCCQLCQSQNEEKDKTPHLLRCCARCSNNFHKRCLELLLPKLGGGHTSINFHGATGGSINNWTCLLCRYPRLMQEKPHTSEASPSKSPKKKVGRRSNSESTSSTTESVPTPPDLQLMLEKILEALKKNEDCWPFKSPVDTKAFPIYKKVIRKPMDLCQVGQKLSQLKYTSEQEFFKDVMLIFTNCKTFNEDNSPVGKCGKSLKKIFMKLWKNRHSNSVL